MHRKLLLFVAALSLIAASAQAQDQIPNLAGTWKAAISKAHVKGKDYLTDEGSTIVKFIEQQGRILHGNVEWDFKGKPHKGSDRFSGVIAKDNKTLYLAGHGEGIRIGQIEGPDLITIYFVVPGGEQPRAGFVELSRVK